MIAASPPVGEDNPVVCRSCGADEMGCELKANYSGRRCCDGCTHTDPKEPR